MATSPLDTILARPGERLTDHTLAVVGRVEQMRSVRPLPAFPRLYQRLVAAAWLHDSGKLARAFQRGLRNKNARWGLRHEALSLGFIHWLVLDEDDRLWVSAAVATHHHDLSFMLHYYSMPQNARQAAAELPLDVAHAWYDWLGAQGLPLAPFRQPDADAILDSIDALERWWEPYERVNFEQHPDLVEIALLRGLMFQADHTAAAGIQQSGPVRVPPPKLAGAFYPHQVEAAASSSSCIILTAPTGSGKTEAALLWAGRQPGHRLYYALPYRASMNAMRERLAQLIPDVGLQHGRALAALYQLALDEGADKTAAQAAARARQQLARLHAVPARIFSPYHLLRLIYQFKGFEAGLADAFASTLIIDEIHAYQPDRLALIIGMLNFLHRHFAVRLFIMTATLPPVAANRLRAAFPDAVHISASAETYARFQRHRLQVIEGDLSSDEGFETILSAVRSGVRVLVTVNTVRRALALVGRARAAGLAALVLHGRFNARDRWRIERAIMSQFSSGQPHTDPAFPLVIATQTIEVSLDVDFDVLYTDPAPLDALVQRFGRVNRRRRVDLAPVYVYSQPDNGSGTVYETDRVRASLAVLREHDGQPIDEARIADWLEQVYQDDDAWNAAYQRKAEDFARVLANIRPLESADKSQMRQFSRLFDEVRVLPLSLEAEYRAHVAAGDLIEAEALLVSISWGQYAVLKRAGQAWPGEGRDEDLYFVTAPYDPETGLNLYADDEDD